ncbi:MAG: acyl carrier protein [Clostridia bacterium]|nr:acyl carrier protein [Clostridia bacterium]
MVYERIKEILADQLDAAADSMSMDSDIAADLGADSLDVVELLMTIEDEFDVEIPDEEIENIKTIGDLVKYIEANKN